MIKILAKIELFFCLAVFAGRLAAADEFAVRQELTYHIDDQGGTRVKQVLEITNLTSKLYAKNYLLNLQSVNVSHVQAKNKNGDPLETKVTTGQKNTEIEIVFVDPAVGKGKTYRFEVTYELNDLAKKSGQIWEITIPRITDASRFESLEMSLVVPGSFGDPAFLSPAPYEKKQTETQNTFLFTKTQLETGTISAIFGQVQIFDFALEYHLENSELGQTITEIALPPDTSRQKVSYKHLDPAPRNVHVDEDGNWIAEYLLKGRQKLDVSAVGQVKIFPPEKSGRFQKKPSPGHFAATQFWPSDNPEIREMADRLSSVEEIYHFVLATLDYSDILAGETRLGALGALQSPEKSLCTEFTDLFIALCRAKGVAAREVNGFAYTTNTRLQPLQAVADILHSWPQYWDENLQSWVSVDPTWQETTGGLDYFHKFDLNHFVFVFHGLSDSAPLPPGSYKNGDETSKDIQIIFGHADIDPTQSFEARLVVNNRLFESREKGELIIKNTGQVALYDLPVKLTAQGLDLQTNGGQAVPILPPHGEVSLPFVIKSQAFAFGHGTLTAKVADYEETREIRFPPSAFVFVVPSFALVLLTILIIKRKIRAK